MLGAHVADSYVKQKSTSLSGGSTRATAEGDSIDGPSGARLVGAVSAVWGEPLVGGAVLRVRSVAPGVCSHAAAAAFDFTCQSSPCGFSIRLGLPGGPRFDVLPMRAFATLQV